jgi:hypothetical protein
VGDDRVIRGKMEVAGVVGPLWFAAWLFVWGYLGLGVGKAVLAILLWPYYLGAHFRPVM